MTDWSWLTFCIWHSMMAYWFEVLLAAARSPVLIVVVRRRLSGFLVRLGIYSAALVEARFFFYFGNSAVSSIATVVGVEYECSERLFSSRVEVAVYPKGTYRHQNAPS